MHRVSNAKLTRYYPVVVVVIHRIKDPALYRAWFTALEQRDAQRHGPQLQRWRGGARASGEPSGGEGDGSRLRRLAAELK